MTEYVDYRRRNLKKGLKAAFAVPGILIALVIAATLVPQFLFTGRFVDDDKVIASIQDQNYRNVSILEKSIYFPAWEGCGGSDDAAYTVRATNAFGEQVTILACAGWPFKGVTIRSKK